MKLKLLATSFSIAPITSVKEIFVSRIGFIKLTGIVIVFYVPFITFFCYQILHPPLFYVILIFRSSFLHFTSVFKCITLPNNYHFVYMSAEMSLGMQKSMTRKYWKKQSKYAAHFWKLLFDNNYHEL